MFRGKVSCCLRCEILEADRCLSVGFVKGYEATHVKLHSGDALVDTSDNLLRDSDDASSEFIAGQQSNTTKTHSIGST